MKNPFFAQKVGVGLISLLCSISPGSADNLAVKPEVSTGRAQITTDDISSGGSWYRIAYTDYLGNHPTPGQAERTTATGVFKLRCLAARSSATARFQLSACLDSSKFSFNYLGGAHYRSDKPVFEAVRISRQASSDTGKNRRAPIFVDVKISAPWKGSGSWFPNITVPYELTIFQNDECDGWTPASFDEVNPTTNSYLDNVTTPTVDPTTDLPADYSSKVYEFKNTAFMVADGAIDAHSLTYPLFKINNSNDPDMPNAVAFGGEVGLVHNTTVGDVLTEEFKVLAAFDGAGNLTATADVFEGESANLENLTVHGATTFSEAPTIEAQGDIPLFE